MLVSALVQPLRGSALVNLNRRTADRVVSQTVGVIRPSDAPESLSWGANVIDVSTGGIGLKLCYPFRPGTFLNVDLQTNQGDSRSFVTRVVHVRDRTDGTWQLGCEFIEPLTDAEIDVLL